MRFLKWISMLTVFAMLCAVLPATVAEDEIVIDLEQAADDGLDLEVEGEGFEAFNDAALSPEDVALELYGLESNLLTSETVEQAQASAVSNASGDFQIDEEGTLVRYGGFEKNVVIPDGVKAIGYNAFENYTAMESVSIPGSVTRIDDSAFEGCTSLKSVTISNGVVSIGWWAFSGCTNLKNISIPDSVTVIGSYAFSDCSSLTEIHLPANMKELESGLFSNCDSLKNIDFLPAITKISDRLFRYCDGLTSITIPSSATAIGENAFRECKNLESVTIHSGVTLIDRTAFEDSNNVIIRGTAGSYAEIYANGVGIPFNAPVVSFDEQTLDVYGDIDYYDVLVLYINQSRTLKTLQKPTDLARTLSWSSSNPDVATVDQNGTVKGISQGTATITAATADGKGKAAQIRILVPEQTEINFSDFDDKEDKEIILGKTTTICVSRNYYYRDETGVIMPIAWTTSDSSVISIESSTDEEATLKGNKLGTATITASTPDGGRASIELTVVRPKVDGVKIDQTGPITLHPGDQYQLTASLIPDEAESTLTWYSDDKDIATVTNDGMVTAIEEGYTYVYVRTDNGYESYIEIYVTPLHPHPDSITIDQTGPITLHPGDQYALTTTMSPEDAAAKLTWGSYNTDIATVSSEGVITAVARGYTEIWVETDNGREAYIDVKVITLPQAVTLDETKATVDVGKSLYLFATVTPDDAETELTWSSSKPSVARVDGYGKVTGLKPGTAKITVKTDNGKTATATVTVKANPTRVRLNVTKATLGVKEKLTLTAKFTPAAAVTALTWSSSKPKVAKVNKKGVVTAVGKGTAVITAKAKNGKTAKVTVTVKAAPDKVTLNKSGTVTLKKGKTLVLKATLPKDTASALTWSSSKPKVAKVDKNGKVTAVGKGTAVITVKTFNNKTAKVTVKVN